MGNCFECARPAVHQHHVVPRSVGGTKTIPLCEACHSKAHGKKIAHPELTRAAMQRMKAQNKLTGQVPHGWSSINGTLVPNEAERRAIARAVEWRNVGVTLREIAEGLYDEGYRNRRGVKFNPSSIRRLLAQAPRAGVNIGQSVDSGR